MNELNRRRFVEYLFAGAVATGACGLATSGLRTRTRRVIVGGGPAGAAAALALRTARPDHPVLLVERDPRRLGRTEARTFERPAAGPDLDILRRAGVEVVLDDVVALDWKAARLDLFSGRSMAFDRLLLAPGTTALQEPIAGLDNVARHLWPAAWGSAREARRLKSQLAALPEAGHVVLRLPNDVSHPAAALNRALNFAILLDRKYPRGRLTILDGSPGSDLVERFHNRSTLLGLDPRADWRTAANGGTVLRVDATRGEIETNAGLIQADVVNFVSPQGAGSIARAAGLIDTTGWCPTDAQGRSTCRPDVIVLGDARKEAKRTVAEALRSAKAAALILDRA
ncbi:MAG: FAD-dependent oxidoreductase [Rhodobacteraceae bacterium]|nr:FAD-dependent oxidoreductase [Paracoccaceae bacterium]